MIVAGCPIATARAGGEGPNAPRRDGLLHHSAPLAQTRLAFAARENRLPLCANPALRVRIIL